MVTWSQVIHLRRWANNIITPGGLFDYTETRIRPSGTMAHIQLPPSLGSDPRSATITDDVWALKRGGSGELILDRRSRRWLCNEARWEASDEELLWWRAPLRLQQQQTAGNQEVQPEAVSRSLDCSIHSCYLLITQIHLSAQTLRGGCQGRDYVKRLWEESLHQLLSFKNNHNNYNQELCY